MPAMIPQKRVLRINLHLNGSWTVNFKFKFRVNLKFVQVLSWILKFPSPILVQRSGTKNANFRTFSTRNYLFIQRNNDPSLQEAHYQTWTCWAFDALRLWLPAGRLLLCCCNSERLTLAAAHTAARQRGCGDPFKNIVDITGVKIIFLDFFSTMQAAIKTSKQGDFQSD